VKNYSNEELSALLECIRRVIPIGNEHWELVADLHAIQYAHCSRNADSIKKKFYKLANQQPGTGNPNIPPTVAMAKEIRETINSKAGINDADVTDFFDDADAALDGDNNDDKDAEILPTTVTTSMRRGSTVSSVNTTNNLSTAASASIANSKAKMKSNQLTAAIETASNATMNAFESHF
jgi:hypothetical protein